jgi:hypothetical protein
MAEDLSTLSLETIASQVAEIRERMRPLERQLAGLREQREVLQTELRRRERLASREQRADLKLRMKSGLLPTVAQLIANTVEGSFEEYAFNLKTGGEVRLGFPGSRSQTIIFTDGRRLAHAQDLAEAARLYAAGWLPGSPGRPGVRIHFPGTRQEKLVDPEDVYVRPAAR